VTEGVVVSKNIVTFREKLVTFFVNTTIHLGKTMRKHRNEQFCKPQQNSSKLTSRAVAPVDNTYPTMAQLKLETALDFIPASLRFLLQHLFVGKNTST